MVPLFIERPVDRLRYFSGGVLLDLHCCAKIIGDEGAQVIGVICRINSGVNVRRQAALGAANCVSLSPRFRGKTIPRMVWSIPSTAPLASA